MSQQKTSPLLTAIVPVTRMAGRFDRLKSWLEDISQLDLEVIIVHDKQDSLTGIEIAGLCKSLNNSNIHLIEKYSGSPGLTRNEGLAKSSGRWISFWDSDDLPFPERILDVLKVLNTHTEIVIGQFELVENPSEMPKYVSHSGNLGDLVLNPGIWRMVFNSKLIGSSEFTKFHLGEDQLYFLQLRPEDREILFTDEVFYRYFQGIPGQLTSQKNKLGDLFEVCKVISAILVDTQSEVQYFAILIFSKNLMTCLKEGSLRLKVQALRLFCLTIAHSSWKTKLLLAVAPIRIVGRILHERI
jgi:glycosyltransferase involved in cell wall biosynthesis